MKCDMCKKEVDPNIHAYTSCSECKGLIFCCVLYAVCFPEHCKQEKCGGYHVTITNPQFIINLKKLNESSEEMVIK